MAQLSGTIQKLDLGIGTWVLVGTDGITYELRELPAALKQQHVRVALHGEILTDAMSIAMVGPIFAVRDGKLI